MREEHIEYDKDGSVKAKGLVVEGKTEGHWGGSGKTAQSRLVAAREPWRVLGADVNWLASY